MPCESPLYAIITRLEEKNHVIILPKRPEYNLQYLQDRYGEILTLPCGSCNSCIQEKRKEWALRCELESYYHKDNCFITLTYDNSHVPDKLNKNDFQDFIKKLRNKGIKFRYFGCGEYGSNTLRPHYHIILFGYMPSDLKVYSKSKSGFTLFTSKTIDAIWEKGYAYIQEFTIETAAYTAGYVNKKLDDVKSGFILMSKKPGIGEQYILDHLNEIFTNTHIVTKGSNKSKVPRYAKKLADKVGYDYSLFSEEKKEIGKLITRDTMLKNGFLHEEQAYKLKKIHFKKRGL